MSIATAIERLADKVEESYSAVAEKDGTIPEEKVLANLPDAIRSIRKGSSSGSGERVWWSPRMTSNTESRPPLLMRPELQDKTVTPATTQQIVTSDAAYDGLSKVTVEKIPDIYQDTSDATATADDIFDGKTAYVNGEKIVGTGEKQTDPVLQEKVITPTKEKQVVLPDDGYDGLSSVEVDAVTTQEKTVTPTTSSQIITPDIGIIGLSKVTVNSIPSGYITTTDATAAASDILSGKTAYVNGAKVTGSLSTVTAATPSISVSSSGLITASTNQSAGVVSSSTKSATQQLTTQSAKTWTPKTTSQTIASGTYLTGTQTISGDSNLVASNIKSGVSIFGVTGSLSSSAERQVLNLTFDINKEALGVTSTNTSAIVDFYYFESNSSGVISTKSKRVSVQYTSALDNRITFTVSNVWVGSYCYFTNGATAVKVTRISATSGDVSINTFAYNTTPTSGVVSTWSDVSTSHQFYLNSGFLITPNNTTFKTATMTITVK